MDPIEAERLYLKKTITSKSGRFSPLNLTYISHIPYCIPNLMTK